MIDLVPAAPDYHLDWKGLTDRFEWIQRLRDCPQDPLHHAEGDVWIHVGMVLHELVSHRLFRSAPRTTQEDVFLAALLHDIAKPDTTERQEDGRISAKGHSTKGAPPCRSRPTSPTRTPCC